MEQIPQEQEYIKGFNHAYLVAEFRPELLQQIVPENNSASDYCDGFFAGKEQWELGKEREQLEELNNLRDDGKDFERECEL